MCSNEAVRKRKAGHLNKVRVQNKAASKRWRDKTRAADPVAYAYWSKGLTTREMSLEEYRQIMEVDTCPRCGQALCPWSENAPGKKDMRTLDQLRPGAGYRVDNCVCLCFRCNTAKRDLSGEEHIALGEWILAEIEKRTGLYRIGT